MPATKPSAKRTLPPYCVDRYIARRRRERTLGAKDPRTRAAWNENRRCQSRNNL
jgi:hypothetical protein